VILRKSIVGPPLYAGLFIPTFAASPRDGAHDYDKSRDVNWVNSYARLPG